ncbi:uncharacterized protein I206_102785 [Kwoniella pini CBS 10737]|uniref:Uncharacterized protein n=1 Tax=Kwoniella pini CBS 10737 TaxID=1296096 RepID=A0A1B9I6C7_9TREE|nr:uncharacterized protein I206_03140 [Kwoniella pini CBS 10737]OCF51074.1 hypothetical protein I206_03140 [Kwoniella pini CBS 10737]
MIRCTTRPGTLSSVNRLSRIAFASTSAEASSSTSSPSTPRRRRSNANVPTSGVDLVAPPDPASNIRPIIYASKPSINPSTNSPYSASEFPTGSSDAKLENMELEWRLRRERVDLMNHRFWATTNLTFEAQKAHRLSLLPPASDPPTEEDERRREEALTQFYADWQIANQEKQIRWVKEWWREVWDGIKIQGKIYFLRALRRSR